MFTIQTKADGSHKSGGAIPADYQQVAYLESTGEQRIMTNFLGTKTLKSEVKIMPLGYRTSNPVSAYYGSRNSATAAYLGIGATTSGFLNVFLGSRSRASNIAIEENKSYTVISDENDTVIDGISTGFAREGEVDPINNFTLFVLSGGSAAQRTPCRIYYAQLYNPEKVFDAIPCYRKSDHKPGMYDTVTNTFFVNQGTGDDFILGPDV